jgi:translation initiation factor IF-2
MSEVTVKQFAETVGIPVDRLLAQLDEAGIEVASENTTITDKQKVDLLAHLRKSHGKKEPLKITDPPQKITLKRKTHSEIKMPGGMGLVKTVSVEVRKKRTYVKRSVVEEEKRRKANLQRQIGHIPSSNEKIVSQPSVLEIASSSDHKSDQQLFNTQNKVELLDPIEENSGSVESDDEAEPLAAGQKLAADQKEVQLLFAFEQEDQQLIAEKEAQNLILEEEEQHLTDEQTRQLAENEKAQRLAVERDTQQTADEQQKQTERLKAEEAERRATEVEPKPQAAEAEITPTEKEIQQLAAEAEDTSSQIIAKEELAEEQKSDKGQITNESKVQNIDGLDENEEEYSYDEGDVKARKQEKVKSKQKTRIKEPLDSKSGKQTDKSRHIDKSNQDGLSLSGDKTRRNKSKKKTKGKIAAAKPQPPQPKHGFTKPTAPMVHEVALPKLSLSLI